MLDGTRGVRGTGVWVGGGGNSFGCKSGGGGGGAFSALRSLADNSLLIPFVVQRKESKQQARASEAGSRTS